MPPAVPFNTLHLLCTVPMCHFTPVIVIPRLSSIHKHNYIRIYTIHKLVSHCNYMQCCKELAHLKLLVNSTCWTGKLLGQVRAN